MGAPAHVACTCIPTGWRAHEQPAHSGIMCRPPTTKCPSEYSWVYSSRGHGFSKDAHWSLSRHFLGTLFIEGVWESGKFAMRSMGHGPLRLRGYWLFIPSSYSDSLECRSIKAHAYQARWFHTQPQTLSSSNMQQTMPEFLYFYFVFEVMPHFVHVAWKRASYKFRKHNFMTKPPPSSNSSFLLYFAVVCSCV